MKMSRDSHQKREFVQGLLGVIKTSTDKELVLKVLCRLRKDVVVDSDGIKVFRELGGVPPMVRFLNKPHEQILALALSVLGNCCSEEVCCKEALECKVSGPLVTILKSVSIPVIQERACRLLGNLAKSSSSGMQLLSTHCPAIAQSVCEIIENTDNVRTRVMAFRACRILLVNPLFLKHFLHAKGFVGILRILAAVVKNNDLPPEEPLPEEPPKQVLGLKGNLQREKYFEEVARNLEGVRSDIFDHEVLKNSTRKSNEYAMPEDGVVLFMLDEILKCLLVLSHLQINVGAWRSLNCTGITFAPIVFFASDQRNKHRTIALKILSNLSKTRGTFDVLSATDAILVACELLVCTDLETTLSENESRHCINIIGMLSADACNRSKIRRSGALRKFITIIRESKSHMEITAVLYLLNNFQYDNMSMELMLRDGLITVLIKELNMYLTSDDDHYKRKRAERQLTIRKRKLPDEASETMSKFAKMQEELPMDYESPSSSPKSTASPCSSRCMSPVGSSLLMSKVDGDDETYSPVCSDDEDDDDEGADAVASDKATVATISSSNSGDDISKLLENAYRSEAIEDNMPEDKEDDDVSQDVPSSKLLRFVYPNLDTLDILENLLYRVTLLVNKRVELGKPETINTLIKAINLFGANNNFAGSLTNILMESQFFSSVVLNGIAHQLYQLTKIKEMSKDVMSFLETLTSVGESNYGISELTRLLRGDDVDLQKRAAIAVAYIIKRPRLLHQYLNFGNALSILLNIILSSKRDEFTPQAVDSLICMSKTLGISVPLIDAAKRKEDYEEFKQDIETPLHPHCDMHFVVHAQQDVVAEDTPIATVKFNKQLLCENSEVFNTMLHSDFREGKEGEIHLSSCSVSGLKYFLNLIVRQSQKLKLNIPPVQQYHALLEAFEMSRIYMMPTMEEFLQPLLVGLLDEHNCLGLLEWSLNNYHADLTTMAINYYLCAPLTTDAKVQLFRAADYSKFSTEWFQFIIDAVFVRCDSGF